LWTATECDTPQDRRDARDGIGPAAATDRRRPDLEVMVLHLNRKPGESFVIPVYGIEVVVMEIKGDRVKLGIEAADEVDIFRREVWWAIQRDEMKNNQGKGGPKWL
jgi:carbon storage regulator